MLEPETLQALSLSRDISGNRTPCDLQIQQGAEYQKGVAQLITCEASKLKSRTKS